MTEVKYLAGFTLKIDGEDASAELIRDIREIVVESSLYQPASFSIVINNDYFPGTETGADPWRYQDTFAIGKAIVIGFKSATTEDTAFSEGAEATAINGEIAAMEADFNPDSQATITIRGYDASHRLYRGRHNYSYQNKKDSDIVKDIAGKVGITVGTVDDTGGPFGYGDINDKSGYVFQVNQTHMEFLRGRAARHGFEMFVEEGKLHFRKPTAGESLELKWLEDIQKIQANITSSEQVSSVEVRAWDYNQKQALVAQKETPSGELITSNEFGQGKSTSSAFSGKPSSPTLRVVNQIFSSQDEGDKIAQALCDETGRDFVQVEATATGNPKLCPGKSITLADIGKYSGTYYLTRVRHQFIEGAYTTDFSVGGIRGEELDSFLAPPTQGGGMMPLIGTVSNNNDPKGWGRVRVKFPTLTEEHESYWARVVSLGAGKDRGWDILPEVNDEVLVLFEGGDIHRPFVVGGLWNGKDAPPEQVANSVVEGKVRLRTLKTRTGHVLQFVEEDKDSQKKGIYVKSVFGHEVQINDTDKSITIKTPDEHTLLLDEKNKKIEAKTSGGHSLLLDDSGKKVELKSSGGNKVLLDDNSRKVEIKDSANTVTLNSSGVSIKGSPKISLSAPQIQVDASAQLELKGGAMVKVNGGIVKLN